MIWKRKYENIKTEGVCGIYFTGKPWHRKYQNVGNILYCRTDKCCQNTYGAAVLRIRMCKKPNRYTNCFRESNKVTATNLDFTTTFYTMHDMRVSYAHKKKKKIFGSTYQNVNCTSVPYSVINGEEFYYAPENGLKMLATFFLFFP